MWFLYGFLPLGFGVAIVWAMTTDQNAKIEALFAARGAKQADGKTPLIEDDTHREWIEMVYGSNRRFAGGVQLGDADLNKLNVLHGHYLGGGP